MAELIWAADAPELSVAQVALRAWMVAPAFDQSIARLGASTPDQSWAADAPEKIITNPMVQITNR
jgi:hypothetical protein